MQKEQYKRPGPVSARTLKPPDAHRPTIIQGPGGLGPPTGGLRPTSAPTGEAGRGTVAPAGTSQGRPAPDKRGRALALALTWAVPVWYGASPLRQPIGRARWQGGHIPKGKEYVPPAAGDARPKG